MTLPCIEPSGKRSVAISKVDGAITTLDALQKVTKDVLFVEYQPYWQHARSCCPKLATMIKPATPTKSRSASSAISQFEASCSSVSLCCCLDSLRVDQASQMP